jgi:hypothetical protein
MEVRGMSSFEDIESQNRRLRLRGVRVRQRWQPPSFAETKAGLVRIAPVEALIDFKTYTALPLLGPSATLGRYTDAPRAFTRWFLYMPPESRS